jgi:hypothetical protein
VAGVAALLAAAALIGQTMRPQGSAAEPVQWTSASENR